MCPSCSKSGSTVCNSNFWLELNYLEVAKAAQSCAAHFTALLYTEIYVDKIKANMEESRRCERNLNQGTGDFNSLNMCWITVKHHHFNCLIE